MITASLAQMRFYCLLLPQVLFIGLLVGDLVHVPAAIAVANAAPFGWSSTNAIGVAIALALALGRTAYFLTKPPSQWKHEE